MVPFKLPRILCVLWLMAMLIMASCRTQEQYQIELLHDLNVDTKADFEALDACQQIKVFSAMASKFTDVDHMVTIVPVWMNETIANQPREMVARCIEEEVANLLMLWDKNEGSKKAISYQIHGLFYMVDNLGLTEYSEVDELFQHIICRREIFYIEQLALVYYTEKFGVSNLPEREEMLNIICESRMSIKVFPVEF